VSGRGRHADAVIVGSGIAGLTTALQLGGCTVITRSDLGAGSSRWAQGGIAAAVGGDDDPSVHARDTVAVSAGLCVDEVVAMITAAAPQQVGWLQRLGVALDVDEHGALMLGREAGHHRRRIVHGGGDATGAAVMRALVAAVRARPDIEVLEHRRAVDLVRSDRRVVGVTTSDRDGHLEACLGAAVVLATGGIGQVFASTTNPVEATGDGLAMAWRAGATIRDPEFVQFHPTALDTTDDPLGLLTEALRGEGAILIDAAGRRYLVEIHPDAELAPRDVVARANWRQRRDGPIFLDARRLGATLPTRFPTVFAAAIAAGVDPRVTPIPTTPAQHYHMGGVETDRDGATSLPALYACGETASVGLHGANRLASNSLLEGLVMGSRVARAITRTTTPIHPSAPLTVPANSAAAEAADPDMIDRLRTLMWEHGGPERDAEGLRHALGELQGLAPALHTDLTGRNLTAVAQIVLRAALARRESRGSHYRVDHPYTTPGPGAHTRMVGPTLPQHLLDTGADRELAS
jgi:L-aspartate oxidase